MTAVLRAAMPREKALTIALASSALALSGVLFWEWTQMSQLQQRLLALRAIPVTAVPSQNVLPEFRLPDAESGFPELLSRNMFAGNRRSVASAGKGGRSAMKKGQFILVGVLITPQQRSALLRDVQTNKTETVALAGTVRGITLGEVESTRVMLRQGAESEELILNVLSGPKLPASGPWQPGQPLPQRPLPTAAPAQAPASAPATGTAPAPAGSPALGASVPARPTDSTSATKPPSNNAQALQKK